MKVWPLDGSMVRRICKHYNIQRPLCLYKERVLMVSALNIGLSGHRGSGSSPGRSHYVCSSEYIIYFYSATLHPGV